MNNSKLAHAWANQIKDNGKGSNMFFENETIYSYGRHFPLAKFVTVNENTFVTYNCSYYSSTTGKHQRHVLNAIPREYQIIRCIDLGFGYYSHERNLNYYLSEGKKALKDATKSRKYKEFLINNASSCIDKFNKYLLLFNLSEFAEIQAEINILNVEIETYQNSDIFTTWLTKREENAKNEVIQKIKNEAENIVKFKEFKVNTVYSLPYNLLRYNVNKNEVETSGGVSISKDLFIMYYNKLKNDQIGIDDKVEQYRFGGKIDNIVYVGCHKFEMNEIETFVNTLN